MDGGYRYPGLVLAWRRGSDQGWEAQVAVVREGCVLVEWLPALGCMSSPTTGGTCGRAQ
jgi:hypothetical protein